MKAGRRFRRAEPDRLPQNSKGEKPARGKAGSLKKRNKGGKKQGGGRKPKPSGQSGKSDNVPKKKKTEKNPVRCARENKSPKQEVKILVINGKKRGSVSPEVTIHPSPEGHHKGSECKCHKKKGSGKRVGRKRGRKTQPKK